MKKQKLCILKLVFAIWYTALAVWLVLIVIRLEQGNSIYFPKSKR